MADIRGDRAATGVAAAALRRTMNWSWVAERSGRQSASKSESLSIVVAVPNSARSASVKALKSTLVIAGVARVVDGGVVNNSRAAFVGVVGGVVTEEEGKIVWGRANQKSKEKLGTDAK